MVHDNSVWILMSVKKMKAHKCFWGRQ